MEPLYRVGELVVRNAPNGNFPEGNGEYIVESVITEDEFRRVYSKVNWTNLRVGYYYKLAGFGVLSKTGAILRHSHEVFLKKKHLPSSESFDKMTSSLKQPQRA